ncbi:YncE family protein [Pelagicoccus enzymogenes]|uniref:YncE family protein n=1 Tax=Pelagicoccus enzymogenes TaxID=2773457 RepID=UPI00280F562F|nr:YncE family protein [Pelagicoccus enzymogenes]MDQ8199413.1 YncE family protein [Pelagicoccus enzymogenes]
MYISANEGKLYLKDGQATVYSEPGHDLLQIVDSDNLGEIRELVVPNTVIGPPSNLDYSKETGWLLVANSVAVESDEVIPQNTVSCIRLNEKSFDLVSEIEVGLQPSGLDIAPDGKSALVANRAAGSISFLTLSNGAWRQEQVIDVGGAGAGVCDVSISPDGSFALYVLREGRSVGVLQKDSRKGTWIRSSRTVALPGLPYRVVIRPDGERAYVNVSSGSSDPGFLACIELIGTEPSLTESLVLAYRDPESVEMSAGGGWLALPMMAGSNLAPSEPGYSEEGRLLVYKEGALPVLFQDIACGAVPEGAAFSEDSLELVVQCHPAKELWVYRREGVAYPFELHEKIPVKGHPSALISIANFVSD